MMEREKNEIKRSMMEHEDEKSSGVLKPGLHAMTAERGLACLPRNSVRLIMFDGPYFISREGDMNMTMANGTKYSNFGVWDFGSPYDYDDLCAQFFRVLKPGGSIIIWSGYEALGDWKKQLRKHELFVKRHLTWEKNNWHPLMAGVGWMNATENAVWATKSEGWNSHVFNKRGQCSSVFHHQSVTDPKKRIHNCQKPDMLYYELARELVNARKNEIIVEPWAGSAPMSYAAKMLGCTYYGFEIDSIMVSKARKLRGL